MTDHVQELSQDQHDRIATIASPVMEYLMDLRPEDAMLVLVSVVSLTCMTMQRKDKAAPIKSFDDDLVPAIRRTIEAGLKLVPIAPASAHPTESGER